MRPLLRSTLLTSAAALTLAVGLTGTAHAAMLGPVAVSGATPFNGCTAGGPIGTVFAGEEVEPWTAVNPRNPANIVTEWQQDRWSNGGARGLVAGVTHDFGKHWKRVVVPDISACSGNNAYDRASDPVVSFSADGRILYAISLSVNHFDPTIGIPDTSAMLISRSTDGGDTWSKAITVRRDTSVPPDHVVFNDKESITADPRDPKKAYAVWDRLDEVGSQPIWFTQTRDGGKTWSKARIIHDPTSDPADPRFTIDNHVLVLPDGTLVDTYAEGSNLNGEGIDWGDETSGQLKRNAQAPAVPLQQQLIRSTDGGRTWSAPIVVSDFTQSFPVDPLNHVPLRTGDLVPSFAVDHRTGVLYGTWQDGAVATSGSGIVVSSSRDGGLTWSKPIKVNKTPDSAPQGSGQAFTPTVDLSATGTVGVTYFDFRKFTGAAGPQTDYWAITCKAGPACATNPAAWHEQHVGGTFDVSLAPVAGGRGYFLGDYMGLDHAGPVFVTHFAMTHPTPPDQQDIYAAAITP